MRPCDVLVRANPNGNVEHALDRNQDEATVLVGKLNLDATVPLARGFVDARQGRVADRVAMFNRVDSPRHRDLDRFFVERVSRHLLSRGMSHLGHRANLVERQPLCGRRIDDELDAIGSLVDRLTYGGTCFVRAPDGRVLLFDKIVMRRSEPRKLHARGASARVER